MVSVIVSARVLPGDLRSALSLRGPFIRFRRLVAAGLFLGFGAGALVSGLTGCTQTPKTGPVEVKYGRDLCSECGMAVSDKRFAAQIRGGNDHKAFIFDDIGCALRYSQTQSWFKESSTEFFVADYKTSEWIQAQKAFYSKVKGTPMNYGYAANKNRETEVVDFQTMLTALQPRIGD